MRLLAFLKCLGKPVLKQAANKAGCVPKASAANWKGWPPPGKARRR